MQSGLCSLKKKKKNYHCGAKLASMVRDTKGHKPPFTLSAPSRFSAEKKSFLGNFMATLVFMVEKNFK